MAYRLYASSVCDMNSAAAAAVCGLWHYTSVICLCLCLTEQVYTAISVCVCACVRMPFTVTHVTNKRCDRDCDVLLFLLSLVPLKPKLHLARHDETCCLANTVLHQEDLLSTTSLIVSKETS